CSHSKAATPLDAISIRCRPEDQASNVLRIPSRVLGSSSTISIVFMTHVTPIFIRYFKGHRCPLSLLALNFEPIGAGVKAEPQPSLDVNHADAMSFCSAHMSFSHD